MRYRASSSSAPTGPTRSSRAAGASPWTIPAISPSRSAPTRPSPGPRHRRGRVLLRREPRSRLRLDVPDGRRTGQRRRRDPRGDPPRLDVHVPRPLCGVHRAPARVHPQCGQLELCAAPIGGIVKTYGGHGRNHFERGVLIGDAGSFVDPMTGEGITPGDGVGATRGPVLEAALRGGSLRRGRLAEYDRAFRSYFDPSMIFLDLCATCSATAISPVPGYVPLSAAAGSHRRTSVRPRGSRLFRRPRHPAVRNPRRDVGAHRPRSRARLAAVPGRRHRRHSLGDLVDWQDGADAVRAPRSLLACALDARRATEVGGAARRRADSSCDPRASGLV